MKGHPRIREGFPGQRMLVLPRPVVERALSGAESLDLLPTDIGYFPDAAWHEVMRPLGSPQMVVILCVRGAGYVRVGSRVFAVMPGSVAVLPPDVAHGYRTSERQPWSILWMHVAGRRVRRLYEVLTDGGASPVMPTGSDAELPALFAEITASLRPPFGADDLLMASLTTGRFFGRLIALHRKRPNAPPARERIESVVRYLSARLAAGHTVPELARLANLSPSHFAAAFKRQTGFSPLDFLIRLRMQRAAHLLDTTTLPVKAVAVDVGYADALYFSRMFHKTHGISPAKYRAIPKG